MMPLHRTDVVQVRDGYRCGAIGLVLETSGDYARLEFSTNDMKHWFLLDHLILRYRPVWTVC